MEEIGYISRQGTWANNWIDESYIEVKLDMFFGVGQ